MSNVWCQFFFVPLSHKNESTRCLRNVRRTHTDTKRRVPGHRNFICPMSCVNSSLSHWLKRMKALGVFETSVGLTQTQRRVPGDRNFICPMSGVNSSLSHWPTKMKALGVFETSVGLTQTHGVASQGTGILYVQCLASILLCPIVPQEWRRWMSSKRP